MTTATASPTMPDPARPQEGTGFLALMRHRNYSLLWTSQLISNLGDRFHWVAISLWVYAETKSALSVSYAIISLLVAPAIMALVAGVVVDHWDRRAILVGADVLRAVVVASIPALMTLGLPWVYAALFLVSGASAFFRPAIFASIPQTVPRHKIHQANAVYASQDAAVEVVGPALAGLVVGHFSYAAALYMDSITYLASAGLLATMRFNSSAHAKVARVAASSVLASIREGITYVRRDQVQLALLALLFGGQWVAGLGSLQTPLAKGVIGITDRQFGWFQSIWGLGFAAASLVSMWLSPLVPRGQTIVAAYVLYALAAGAMGISVNLGMLVVAGFWVGFANIMFFVNVSTVIMEHTPDSVIGRTVTIRQLCLAIVRTAALLGFGWLADVTSVRFAVVTMAGLGFLGTITMTALFPSVWRYRSRVQTERTQPSKSFLQSLPKPPFGAILARVAAVDPQFSPEEQHWLNLAVLAVVATGWLVVLTSSPVPAVFTLATALTLWGGASLVRRVVR